MRITFKKALVVFLSVSEISFAQQNLVTAEYFKRSQPTMNEFLTDLSDSHVKTVINGRFSTRHYLKRYIQKIILEQRVSAMLITGSLNSQSATQFNQIFDDLEYNLQDKNLSHEKAQNCNELDPNNQLSQKLCILSIEKIMDQTLLDHGYSKLTSTVITNFTVLEKQIFFTNDPNQEFVVIALPALSTYGGVNGIQSVLNNGVYFVVYKRTY